MDEVGDVCAELGVPLHIDGARIMNSCVAHGTPPSEMAEKAASVSVCLSKGLGSPVGSVLVGSEEIIYKARRMRKACGGGMRQAGVIAAAGLYALENNVDRLAGDHARAAIVAEGMEKQVRVCEERSDQLRRRCYEVSTDMAHFPLT